MILNNLKGLIIPLLCLLAVLPALGKRCTYSYTFEGDVFGIKSGSTATTGTVNLGGVDWTMLYSKNTTSSDMTTGRPSGILAAQKIIIPKAASSTSSSYFFLSSEFFKDKVVEQVFISTWNGASSYSSDAKLIIQSISGTSPAFNFNKSGSTSDVTVFPESYTHYIGPYEFINREPEGSRKIVDALRFAFTNTSTNSTFTFGISSIEIIYDDGELEPQEIPLQFTVNGNPAESGCFVNKGDVLNVVSPEVPNASITYLVGDNKADDLLDENGLVLNTPGYFVYHVTAKADGYKDTSMDFTVSVAGQLETRTIDMSKLEEYGLTLYPASSPDYETKHRWWTVDDVDFFFNKNEKIRLSTVSDDSVQLVMYAGTALQVGMSNYGFKIIGATVEGYNADRLVIRMQTPEDVVPPEQIAAKRAVSTWNSEGEHTSTIVIENKSAGPAGIKTLSLEVDEDTETIVTLPGSEDINAEPVLYDLQGREIRTATPAPGIYIERRGNTSRKVLICR